MKTLIFGGTGFVGLNITEQLLARGEAVVLFDRLPLPDAAATAFAPLPGRLEVMQGDVTEVGALARAVVPGVDTVILGAAITAAPAREASDPETILQVHLMALPAILRAASGAGVRRIINLSSAAVYGAAAIGVATVDEAMPPQPVGLYGITKFASEMIGARLAGLWSLDFVTLRLSAVFGPWERATGVRDTLSAPGQILAAARGGTPALLARPGMRDWICANDVAQAVQRIARADTLAHQVYNVSTADTWSALAWGEALAARHPGFVCRLTQAEEAATVDLHSSTDRAPLSVGRLRDELGWQAGVGLEASVAHCDAWSRGAGATFR